MIRICRACELIAAISLAAMMCIVVLDVVLRYVLNMPIAASIELVEAGIVGTVFMALPSASASGAHISIDYIDDLLSRAARELLDRLSHLFIAVLLAGLAFLLVRRGLTLLARGDLSVSLHYPTGYIAMFMALAVAMTALVHFSRFLRPGNPVTIPS